MVVKCGTEEEVSKPKAGNRGKRDSQVRVYNPLTRIINADIGNNKIAYRDAILPTRFIQ